MARGRTRLNEPKATSPPAKMWSLTRLRSFDGVRAQSSFGTGMITKRCAVSEASSGCLLNIGGKALVLRSSRDVCSSRYAIQYPSQCRDTVRKSRLVVHLSKYMQ